MALSAEDAELLAEFVILELVRRGMVGGWRSGGGGGRRGPQGPPGLQGEQGPVGPAGPGCELVLTDPDASVDNGAIINAAIDSLAVTGGGTVCLGPGDWVQDTSVRPRDGVSIKGVGAATVLRWRDGHVGTAQDLDRSLIAFRATDIVSDVSITDLALDGNQASVMLTHHCIRIDTVTDVRIRDVVCRNAELDGVYIIDVAASGRTDGVEVHGVVVRNCMRNSFSVISGENIIVAQCTSYQPGNSHVDIEPDMATEVVTALSVVDNHFEDTTLTTQAAMTLTTSLGVGTVQDVIVADNIFRTQGFGINVGGNGGTIRRVKIHGNDVQCEIRTIDADGIQVRAPATQVEVLDNRVDITNYTTDGHGIFFNQVTFCDARDNAVSGTENNLARVGIRVDRSSDVCLTGNRVIGYIAVGHSDGNQRIHIVANKVRNLGTTVPIIQVGHTQGFTIVGNECLGGQLSVYLNVDSVAQPCTDGLIADNLCLEFDLQGLRLNDAVNALRIECRGNHVRSASVNVTFGIVLLARQVCVDNYIELVGSGAAGTAGIFGANTTVVDRNVVRQGNSVDSIFFAGGSTGYTCSYNRTVVAPTLGGTPVEAVFNALIAA